MRKPFLFWTLAICFVGCSGGQTRPTTGGLGAGPRLTPPSNLFLRVGFDTDPSAYLGRFVPDSTPPGAVDESGSLQLTCSRFYSVRKVGRGNVEYDEYFRASSEASAKIAVPNTGVGVSASGEQGRMVRIKYRLKEKWIAELKDPQAFKACCKQAPDQCTRRVVGEFLGGTGEVYYAQAAAGEVSAGVESIGAVLDFKDGYKWRRAMTFPEPVFFAFKLTGSIVDPTGSQTVA